MTRPSGFAANHGGAERAVVVMVRNALRPKRDRAVMPVLKPVTIRGWLEGQGIAEFAQPTICLVNGRAVLRAEWSVLVIRPGDVVCFVTLPHHIPSLDGQAIESHYISFGNP